MPDLPLRSTPPSGTQRLAERLEKPLTDDRSYRVVQLPNQLEVLLIHDAETDKASAAMDVDVGSFSDPEEMPGMAHAVEHALFMGTGKYPGENEYNSYLTRYAGSSNAFTAVTSTNYYFELSASSTSNSPGSSAATSQASLVTDKAKAPLYGALDRFAQFFIDPLFSADTLDRELRAVDSENKKNLQSDPWRLQQLNKSLSSKKHPFHMFSTGDYKLLHDDPIARGVEIRSEFIKFYQRNYSANRMKLSVVGRESLDELQSWVEELFAGVHDQNLPQQRWDDIMPYGPDELCTQIFAKPVMDTRMLDIYFPYPDEEDLYASQPGRYISHLIGHEGPGSILAYIKAKGWANSLSAGSQPVCPGTAFFCLSIRLTEDGLREWHAVVKTVFQYIGMLREQPPHAWIYDEMSKLAEVHFKFQEKIPASRMTSMLSGVMQKPIPRDQLLSASQLLKEFNPDAVRRGLEALRPDNFRVTIVSQEVPGTWDKKEKWYGTEYRYEKIPQDFMREIEEAATAPAGKRPADLHLPGVNEFVPQRLEVEKKEVKEPTISPKLIRNDESVRTWWKKDDRFWVPKANIHLALRSALSNQTPFLAVMTWLFTELVQDSLTEYSYDAELAGLDYSLTQHGQGMDVTVSGYNDKMSVLLEKVLTTMRDLDVKPDRFAIVKEKLARALRNFDLQAPFRQIATYSRWLATERSWSNAQLLDEISPVSAEDVRRFVPLLLRQLHLELLVHGNLLREDALHITDLVERTLRPHRLPAAQWPVRRSVVLPPGSDFRYVRTLRNPDNVNHCVEYILAVGNNVTRTQRAQLLLLAQIIEEPVFDTLRTKEQLGYIVGSNAVLTPTAHGFRILIQSEKDCGFLESRIERFLTGFEATLKEMGEEEFEAHKVALINRRLEKLKTLDAETGRFWAHITGEVLDFGLVYRDVEHIEPLTPASLLTFYIHHFAPHSPIRAKTSIHLVAQSTSADVAARSSVSEKRDQLRDVMVQMLGQFGLPDIDANEFSKRLAKIEVGGEREAVVKGVVEAVAGYLTEVAGVAEEEVEGLVGEAGTAVGGVLAQLGIGTAEKGAGQAEGGEAVEAVQQDGDVEGAGSKAVVIEDVKAFRASMALSAGVTPVADVSAFEDAEPKL